VKILMLQCRNTLPTMQTKKLKQKINLLTQQLQEENKKQETLSGTISQLKRDLENFQNIIKEAGLEMKIAPPHLTETGEKMCYNDEEKAAEIFCEDCKVFYCNQCDLVLHLRKTKEFHKRTELEITEEQKKARKKLKKALRKKKEKEEEEKKEREEEEKKRQEKEEQRKEKYNKLKEEVKEAQEKLKAAQEAFNKQKEETERGFQVRERKLKEIEQNNAAELEKNLKKERKKLKQLDREKEKLKEEQDAAKKLKEEARALKDKAKQIEVEKNRDCSFGKRKN